MTTETKAGPQRPAMMYIGPGMANKDVISAIVGVSAVPLAPDEDVLINYGRFRSVLRMLMDKADRIRGFASGGYVGARPSPPLFKNGEYVIPRGSPMKDPKYERIRMAAEALARELDEAGTEFDVKVTPITIETIGAGYGGLATKHQISITKTTKETVYP